MDDMNFRNQHLWLEKKREIQHTTGHGSPTIGKGLSDNDQEILYVTPFFFHN